MNNVELDLIKFLEEMTQLASGHITIETELIESGLVDSLNIVSLLAYLEGKVEKPIHIEDIDLMDISTVGNIVQHFLIGVENV